VRGDEKQKEKKEKSTVQSVASSVHNKVQAMTDNPETITRLILHCEYVIDDTAADDTAHFACDAMHTITHAYFTVRTRQVLSEEQKKAAKEEARKILLQLNDQG
jgi:hypothetical protein